MKFIFVALWLSAICLDAQCAPNLGVRAQSLGEAIRAEGSSNDAIFYNPASIIKHRRISMDFDYLLDFQANGHRLGASMVDSQTGPWGIGLAYSGRFVAKSDRPSSHLVYLSSAMPIVTDMFALGTSLHYTHDRGFGHEAYANFFNMDAALLANLPFGLSFAVVADHLLTPKGHEKDLGLAIASSLDLGAIVPALPLSLSLDWLMDDVKSESNLHHVLATGMQFIVLGMAPLRLGYRADMSKDQKLLSLGCGLLLSGVALDGLYQQNIHLGKERHFGLALRWSI